MYQFINLTFCLGWDFFHKVLLSDVFVLLDNVQFEKNSFNNRNKVKTANELTWLTVPVQTKGKFGINLNEIKIDPKQLWQKKHLNTIMFNYKRAPYFDDYFSFFEDIYQRKWERLIDLNLFILDYLFKMLEIDTKIILASSLEIYEKKSELVLNICKYYKSDIYISGKLGKDYLIADDFKQAGIEIYYQDYLHPEYKQLFRGFQPYLSIIDLLFNHGSKSKEILLSGEFNKE